VRYTYPNARPNVLTGAEAYFHRDGLKAESVAFSLDGKLIAAAGEQPFIDVWDCATRTHVRRLDVSPSSVKVLAFADSPPWLAVSSDDRLLRFFDLDTGKVAFSLPTPAPLHAVQFIPGSNLLVMLSAGNAEVWGRSADAVAWELREEIPAPNGQLAVGPSG